MHEIQMMPVGSNTFAIRVDEFADGTMHGAFFGPTMSQETPFSSLTGLIIMIDEMLDQSSLDGSMALAPIPPTFKPDLELEVLFRQNQSWQGRIRFLDAGNEAVFRSVLELLIILQMRLGA